MEPASLGELDILGIDPAPGKDSTVCSGDGSEWRNMQPQGIRSLIEGRLAAGRRLLVAWDSPLSFDTEHGYSDRLIDKTVRRWVGKEIKNERIQDGAVSVRPFSGCPHWTVSCAVLGLPFGTPPPGLSLLPLPFLLPEPGKCFVVETHPAVALAVLWIEKGLPGMFPRYKGSAAHRGNSAIIADKLNLPKAAGKTDDTLDAYMGWQLARWLVAGEAFFAGSPKAGGYLLPRSAAKLLGLEKPFGTACSDPEPPRMFRGAVPMTEDLLDRARHERPE